MLPTTAAINEIAVMKGVRLDAFIYFFFFTYTTLGINIISILTPKDKKSLSYVRFKVASASCGKMFEI